MGVFSTNLSEISAGALISASHTSDLYNVLSGNIREDVVISGSLTVIGDLAGNLQGTAATASYVLNAVTASYVESASYALNSTSSSFALTASYAVTETLIETSSSFADFATSASQAQNSNFAVTASYVDTISNRVLLNTSGYSVLYVAPNGDDNTAIIGDTFKPYQTLEAAFAAAGAGDLIYVFPGLYTNSTRINNESKNINFYFEPGAVVELTTDFIRVNGYTVTIRGAARFKTAATFTGATGNPAIFAIVEANSTLDAEVDELILEPKSYTWGINCTGHLRLVANKIYFDGSRNCIRFNNNSSCFLDITELNVNSPYAGTFDRNGIWFRAVANTSKKHFIKIKDYISNAVTAVAITDNSNCNVYIDIENVEFSPDNSFSTFNYILAILNSGVNGVINGKRWRSTSPSSPVVTIANLYASSAVNINVDRMIATEYRCVDIGSINASSSVQINGTMITTKNEVPTVNINNSTATKSFWLHGKIANLATSSISPAINLEQRTNNVNINATLYCASTDMASGSIKFNTEDAMNPVSLNMYEVYSNIPLNSDVLNVFSSTPYPVTGSSIVVL